MRLGKKLCKEYEAYFNAHPIEPPPRLSMHALSMGCLMECPAPLLFTIKMSMTY